MGLPAVEGPTDCPEPVARRTYDDPLPRPPRDYTGKATHLLTCAGCGHRIGIRTREPFGWTKAIIFAAKISWLRSVHPSNHGEHTFTCRTCQE